MTKIIDFTSPDIGQELARLIRFIFRGREDVVPRFYKPKDPEKPAGYAPICRDQWKQGICPKPQIPCHDCLHKNYVPLSNDLLVEHLKGKHILGVYPVLPDNTCCFLAFDFDNHDGNHDPLKDAMSLYEVCVVQDIPCYWLRSKSGNGYHVYIFFNGQVPAWKARLVGLAILQEAQVVGDDDDVSSFDKMFPSQDELTSRKPLGNLIALPFQGKAAESGHTLFLDPGTDFQDPFPNQIELLKDLSRVTEADLDRLIKYWGLVKNYSPVPKNQAKKSSAKTTKPFKPTISTGTGKVPEGRRNTTLTSTAGSLRQRGLEFEEIKEALMTENQKRCVPPLPEGEVESIARSIAGYPAGAPKEDQAAKLAWAKEAVAGLSEKVKSDQGAPFEAPIPLALMVIKEKDPAEWARIRKVLQYAKVCLKDLETAMRQAGAQARSSDNANGEGQSGPAHPYSLNDGVLSMRQRGREGDYLVPLCNFNAYLIGERVYDDGAEQTVVFQIKGERKNGQPLPIVEVPASQFPNLGWVNMQWGSQAVLNQGPATKEHTRAAIQLLSEDVSRETVYAHLGWKRVNGVWVYLHHGGGIGKDGLVPGISVSLGDSRLKDYDLPEPPSGEQLKSAVRASLLLLKLVPPRIAYPLIAGTYRATWGGFRRSTSLCSW